MYMWWFIVMLLVVSRLNILHQVIGTLIDHQLIILPYVQQQHIQLTLLITQTIPNSLFQSNDLYLILVYDATEQSAAC